MSTEKIPVVAVVGPTASGKTALGVELALRFGGEIVSADSMQVYDGVRIATARPTEEETRGVPHWLLGFLPVTEVYSVADFVRDATAAVNDIRARGRLPILVGGTGLYVDSFLQALSFEDEPEDASVREALEARLRAGGLEPLSAELSRIDPAAAMEIDLKNPKRVIRALETYALTGELPSVRRARALSAESPYAPVYIGLMYENRENLYARIERRADAMLAEGLLEEAGRFLAQGLNRTAAQAIGFKELEGYLRGEEPLSAAREKLIRATRRYAKRQMTWFRRNPSVRWIVCDGRPIGEIAAEGEKILLEAGIQRMGEEKT